MLKKSVKILLEAILIAMIIGTAYYALLPLDDNLQPYLNSWQSFFLRPSLACQQPITYRLGYIDDRFQLSATEADRAIKEAAAVWAKPAGKPLFAAATSGKLVINFVYDYRQAATDKLKELGIVVEDNQKSYDSLKARYDLLKRQYSQKKAVYDQQVREYKSQQAAYDIEVAKWNAQGGAPQNEFTRLNNLAGELEKTVKSLNAQARQLNQQVDQLNALVTSLNSLIIKLNLNVNKYNNISGQTGEEFEQGVYQWSENGTEINVYEFKTQQQLVRLLIHELGHALGLDHTSSTDDIMYYLNDSADSLSANNLTANDLAALRQKCGIQ